MAVVIGTNSGFVTEAPLADPSGSATVMDTTSVAISSVTPSGTAKITQIGWFCSNSTQETNFEVGIYEDNGSDLPGDLISSSTTNAKGTGSGWKTVTVDIALSADTKYWIAVQVDDTATTTFIDYTNSPQRRSLDNASTQLVDPWVNDGTGESITIALYALVAQNTIAQSTSFESNNGTFVSATLTPTFTGNTPTFRMRADKNESFEDVSEGVRHFFSNSGSEVQWQAEGLGTTIQNIKIEVFP